MFARATIDDNDVIQPKSLKNPYIFRTKEGDFGIVAIRINSDGSRDEESKGQILLWTSRDLITFNEQKTVTLKDGVYVDQVVCQYDGENKRYKINWRDAEGKCHENILTNLTETVSISSTELTTRCSAPCNEDFKNLNLPNGAIVGNTIPISKKLGEKLLTEWLPLENVDVSVPAEVEIDSLEELKSVEATAIYSDGSKPQNRLNGMQTV